MRKPIPIPKSEAPFKRYECLELIIRLLSMDMDEFSYSSQGLPQQLFFALFAAVLRQ